MRTFLVAASALVILAAQGGTAAAQGTTAGDPVNGEAVFRFGNTSCSNCHGNGAVGGWGPDLAGRNISVAAATRAIRNPIWKMPTFVPSQLTQQEIVDMVAYWDSLPPTPAIGEWRTKAPVDAPWGQQLAVNIIGCGQCHGATLTTPRHGAAEVGADFDWFKNMVYNHSTAMPEKFSMREAVAEGTPGPRRRVRMGNYSRHRLPEETLRVIWDWMNDMGLLVPVQARVTAAPATGGSTTYTLAVKSEALPDGGLTAEDVTVSLMVPAGTKLASATGTGYQGVSHSGDHDMATWRLPRLGPQDGEQFTFTLTGTAANDEVPRGTVGWARPVATSDALVNFAYRPGGGRGGGAGE